MNSRSKGQRGEREWRDYLKHYFPWLDLRRGIQSRAGGAEAMDVEGLPGYLFEVKRVESLNIWSALTQAIRDSFARPEVDLRPIVAFRRNRSEWYVAMRAADFMDLVYYDVATLNPPPDGVIPGFPGSPGQEAEAA